MAGLGSFFTTPAATSRDSRCGTVYALQIPTRPAIRVCLSSISAKLSLQRRKKQFYPRQVCLPRRPIFRRSWLKQENRKILAASVSAGRDGRISFSWALLPWAVLSAPFTFSNGAELLRAAAAWGREFLYSRPALASEIDNSSQPSAADRFASTNSPSSNSNRPSPFDRNFWPSTLSQPTTFANVSPSGGVSPGSPFSVTGSLLTQLNTLQRGADALFQSFYQTAISMKPKTVTRTASKTVSSARRKISSAQQNATAQANSTKSTAQSMAQSTAQNAQQTANALQNQSMLNAIRSQNQSLMGGALGGLSYGAGLNVGGLSGHH